MFINNHSYFSLRYGTVAPESILKMAQKQGIKTLALTDINNTSASLDFVRMAPKYNIKPVLGVDFRNNGIQKFIILAQNNNGFQQINAYLSHFTSTQICDIPERAKTLKDTVVIYPYIKCRHFKLKKMNSWASILSISLNLNTAEHHSISIKFLSFIPALLEIKKTLIHIDYSEPLIKIPY